MTCKTEQLIRKPLFPLPGNIKGCSQVLNPTNMGQAAKSRPPRKRKVSRWALTAAKRRNENRTTWLLAVHADVETMKVPDGMGIKPTSKAQSKFSSTLLLPSGLVFMDTGVHVQHLSLAYKSLSPLTVRSSSRDLAQANFFCLLMDAALIEWLENRVVGWHPQHGEATQDAIRRMSLVTFVQWVATLSKRSWFSHWTQGYAGRIDVYKWILLSSLCAIACLRTSGRLG